MRPTHCVILPVETSATPPEVPGSVPRRGWRRGPSAALVSLGGLVVAHFLWVTAHLAPAIMSPDANGYVVQARLLAQEGRTSFSPTSPVQFIGMHWLETERGVFFSRYPAGLPVIFAGAWQRGGLKAALWVNPFLASGTVLLIFFLARRLVPAGYALLAAAFLAVIPVVNQHALDADAHIAATFFLVAGVLELLRFGDAGSLRSGLLAGLLLGAVPTMRYPEAIVGGVIAVWLVWRVRPVWRVWPALVGAALPLCALGVHNAAAFGAFWKTGYALTHEQTGFGFKYLAGHALPYLHALGGQGIALLFAFGVAGLTALALDRAKRPEGVLFTGIVVPLLLLYMAYYFGGGGGGGGGAAAGNLRFLIPTFPFFVVAAVGLLARLAADSGRNGRVVVAVVATLQLLLGFVGSSQVLAAAHTSLGAAARARIAAEGAIPADSVIIVDRQLAESLDATGRWRLVEESFVVGGMLGGGGMGGGGLGFPGGPRPAGEMGGRGSVVDGAPTAADGPERAPGDPGRGDEPNPMQRGKNRAQQERYAGLRPVERRQRVWADVVAWAGGKPVFWFARSLEVLDRVLPVGADYHSITEVDAPMMIGSGGGGPPGMGGPKGGGGFNAGPSGGGSLSRPSAAGPRSARLPPPVGGPGQPEFSAPRGGPSAAFGPKLRLVQIDFAPP